MNNEITYADKVALNQNSSVPDINKVNASDMNEIKAKHNGCVNGTIPMGNIETNTIKVNQSGLELYGQTPFIDFHHNSSSSDYTSRIIEEDNGVLAIPYNLKVEGQFRRYWYAYRQGTTCDFDNIINEGYYEIKTEATQSNGPVAGVDAIMEVKRMYFGPNDNPCVIQELYDYNTQKWYKRIYWYQVFWTNWIALN